MCLSLGCGLSMARGRYRYQRGSPRPEVRLPAPEALASETLLAKLAQSRFLLLEPVEAHAVQDRRRLRELDVSVLDDLDAVAPRVSEVEPPPRQDLGAGLLQRSAHRLLRVDDQPEVAVGVRRLGTPLGERDELIPDVDEGHPAAAAAQLQVEDAAVEGKRLVDGAHLEGHVIHADEPWTLGHASRVDARGRSLEDFSLQRRGGPSVARMEHTVTVNRPAEEVFDYLADVRHLPEWQDGVVEVRSDGEPRAGSRFVEVRSFLGKRIESTIEIVAYEPSTLFTIKVIQGPIPFEVRHTIEPEGSGTRVHVVGEGEPGGFFKLAEGLVTRQVQKAAEKDFAQLKQVLEAAS